MFDEFARGLHWLGQGAGAAVGMDEEPDPVELLKNPIVTIRRLGDYPLLMVIGAACLWAAAAGAFVMISPGASAQVTEGGLQTSVGIANKVVREVKGKRGAYVRQIALKDEVYQNERISTGPGAAAEIVLRDNTRISLGPKSSLVLDKFVFDPMPSRRKVVMNAVGGVFRFVTGNSPSNSYQIKTGSATLGIRGTIFTLIVAFNGAATGGAVLFSNLAGDSVLVTPGLSSSIQPPAADGTQSAPSAPAEPSLPVTSTTQQIETTLAETTVTDLSSLSTSSGGDGGVAPGTGSTTPGASGSTSGPGGDAAVEQVPAKALLGALNGSDDGIEDFLVRDFQGYESHRPIYSSLRHQEYWYETCSDSARLNRNLRRMLEYMSIAGRVTFAGNTYMVEKITVRGN